MVRIQTLELLIQGFCSRDLLFMTWDLLTIEGSEGIAISLGSVSIGFYPDSSLPHEIP